MTMYRLFFALWPDEKVRHSIVETFTVTSPQMRGRVIQPHNLHITLHFIGQVSGDVKQRMHAVAQTVVGESFVVGLNCFGHFPKVKIFWMGPQKPPVELTQLHNKLGDALSKCGYQCDSRPYNPHVTLMRNCIEPVIRQPEFTIPWTVDEFVLVESSQGVSGVNYRVVEQYPLS